MTNALAESEYNQLFEKLTFEDTSITDIKILKEIDKQEKLVVDGLSQVTSRVVEPSDFKRQASQLAEMGLVQIVGNSRQYELTTKGRQFLSAHRKYSWK